MNPLSADLQEPDEFAAVYPAQFLQARALQVGY